MFICLRCNATFHEPDEAVVDRYPYGEQMAAVTGAVCPYCGHEEIADAIECDICGKYFDECDLNYDGELMVCDSCEKREHARVHLACHAEDL